MIGVNKIADLDKILNSIMGFRAHIMEKIRILVENHYQLHGHSNGANYLKSLQTGWISLDPNLDKVYDMTTSILQLILPIIYSQKLANLPRP